MKKAIIGEVIASLLILLFMYAALTKLLDYQTFKVQLSKSPFITEYASVLAWALPIGEILVALMLTFNRTRLFGLYSSLFLMAMFTAYIYMMLHYSLYIPCSCGGVLSKMGWGAHLWFNVGFCVISLIGIFLNPGFKEKNDLDVAENIKIIAVQNKTLNKIIHS